MEVVPAGPSIQLWYDLMDYDGERFYQVNNSIKLESFKGEREVVFLECFPLKFHPNCDRILSTLAARGARFKSVVESNVKYQYYSGWTLAAGPYRRRNSYDEDLEYIEGEVIVDVKEGARHLDENGDEWEGWVPRTTLAMGHHDTYWTAHGDSCQCAS